MELNDQKQKKTPKVGVVLSSGGLKPISSLALFEFLDEEKIDVDLMVGCSGGGVLAAFRGTGYDNQQIVALATEFLSQKVFSQIDYQTLLNIGRLPYGKFNVSQGLFKKGLFLQTSQKLFGTHQLEDLKTKTLLQTTDIQTGAGVIQERGPLGEAVYASLAMYPLLPPIQIGGRWLVDGAFSAPLPVLEAVKRNMDVIIVMLFHEELTPEPRKFVDGFSNIIRAASLTMIKSQLALAIDMHHHEIIVINVPFINPVSLSDVNLIPNLLELGRRAVDEKKEEILHAIKGYSHIG